MQKKPQPKKPVVKKPQRRYLKDVKAGEVIQIEWYRIKGGIGNLKVLNNDPEMKAVIVDAKTTIFVKRGTPQNEIEKKIKLYTKNNHL